MVTVYIFKRSGAVKKIIIMLFLCIGLTGCLVEDTLLEILLKNDYEKVDEQIFRREAKGGTTSTFYFDKEKIENNYFEFDNGVYKIKYFYKQNISKINECVYDFATETLQPGNTVCKEYYNFLKIIKDVYENEIIRLNILEEELYILQKNLD